MYGAIWAVKTTLSPTDNSVLKVFQNEIKSLSEISGENIIHYEYIYSGEKVYQYGNKDIRYFTINFIL